MNFRGKKGVLFMFSYQDIMSYYFLMCRTLCPVEGLGNVKHSFIVAHGEFCKSLSNVHKT